MHQDSWVHLEDPNLVAVEPARNRGSQRAEAAAINVVLRAVTVVLHNDQECDPCLKQL